MNDNLGFSLDGWDGYISWQMEDKRTLKKINSLIADIVRNGYEGIRHPEPLKGDLSGYWSREIDKKNRLVYRIFDDGKIEIIHCGGHYDDKQLKNKKVNTIIQGSFENSLFIGKDILIYIDRPIGSKHPQHHFEYLLNYGYVPNTKTDDGEELDAYILGISYPLDTFCGKVIAMIHRTNDADDKLIVTNGQNFTNEQIYEFTYFQEQYFQSEIIRTQRPIYTI